MFTPPIPGDPLREALDAAGFRATPQRAAVYRFLQRAEHHPTAEDVYRAVKTDVPSISLAAVYKALEALVVSRLVSRVAAGEGPARYDARGDDHYHLRCLRSGDVQDLATPYDPDLVRKLDPDLLPSLQRLGFHLVGYRLELVGYFDATKS